MSTIASSLAVRPTFGATTRTSDIPPLESGDRLNLREFLRRYAAMPHVKKAELIEGTVFMGAAVRHTQHGRPHSWLSAIVATYGMRAGLDFGDNSTVELDQDNAPQPDVLMFLPTEFGGRAKVNTDGYLEGPPDFVAEISASTVSIDLHGKFRAYKKNGVREYVVWRVQEDAVDWFVLESNEFLPLAQDENGIYRSRLFPGLWLNVPALLGQNAEALWATLDAGLATNEFRDFAARIKQAAATRDA